MRYALLCIWVCIYAGEASAQARIESEYKIAVPQDQVAEVWAFLQTAFGKNELDILPQDCITQSAVETFYDIYFDDQDESLLGQNSLMVGVFCSIARLCGYRIMVRGHTMSPFAQSYMRPALVDKSHQHYMDSIYTARKHWVSYRTLQSCPLRAIISSVARVSNQ